MLYKASQDTSRETQVDKMCYLSACVKEILYSVLPGAHYAPGIAY